MKPEKKKYVSFLFIWECLPALRNMHRVFTMLFSCPVMSNSFNPMDCSTAGPSPSPKVWPSSCPLFQWCHPATSSSDTILSFCPQSFPASRTFPMSQLFVSDNQNTGISTSASVFSTSIQGWFPLRLTGLISLPSKRLSGVFPSTTVWRHQFFGIPPSLVFRQV